MAQIPIRQRIHTVVMQTGVHGVRHQHRVINRVHGDAFISKNLSIVFHVLADFHDAQVFKHWLEHTQASGKIHLLLGQRIIPEQIIRIATFMGQRNIAGRARIHA